MLLSNLFSQIFLHHLFMLVLCSKVINFSREYNFLFIFISLQKRAKLRKCYTAEMKFHKLTRRDNSPWFTSNCIAFADCPPKSCVRSSESINYLYLQGSYSYRIGGRRVGGYRHGGKRHLE